MGAGVGFSCGEGRDGSEEGSDVTHRERLTINTVSERAFTTGDIDKEEGADNSSDDSGAYIVMLCEPDH